MALFPEFNETQLKPMPGMHGEYFTVDIPGFRDGDRRVNRTNNRLSVGPHDALGDKYLMDTRLPVLFTYGFGIGYNKMVAPKGRIVAADPVRDAIDWDTDKQFNVLTLANGGALVRLREATDLYPSTNAISAGLQGQKVYNVGREWIPTAGMADAYGDVYYRSVKKGAAAQATDAGLTTDAKGNFIKDGKIANNYRAGNKPLGMIERNEYNRFNNDSFDGYMPGPIVTDAAVELPYFAFKDKAEGNPWGSIYGNIAVGDLVKSDENGRLTSSPLNSDTLLETMTAAEIERERQQVMGQVITIRHDMVPEGGYKWATWALADRLKYEGFAPDLYTQNNRPGEDTVNSSVYQSTGRYPGYPVDTAFTEHDLHMLSSGQRLDNYDKFMNPQWQYEHLGIPGLTDGYNVAVRELENNSAVVIRPRVDTNGEYVQHNVKIDMHGNVEADSVKVELMIDDGTSVTQLLAPTSIVENNGSAEQALGTTGFGVSYFNAVQGMIQFKALNAVTADTTLAGGKKIIVNIKYKKRGGVAGIPTFMDWDGCVGAVTILLQR